MAHGLASRFETPKHTMHCVEKRSFLHTPNPISERAGFVEIMKRIFVRGFQADPLIVRGRAGGSAAAAPFAAKFKSRREAKDWCVTHYPGSLIKEIGADKSERRSRAMPRGKGLCAETVYVQPK